MSDLIFDVPNHLDAMLGLDALLGLNALADINALLMLAHDEAAPSFWRKFQHPLVWFGFAAQVTFMLRFVVQWYVSERRKKSTVPESFWWLSLSGGIGLAIYAFLNQDPVILVGQMMGVAIYLRNLALIYSRKARIRARSAQSRAAAAAAEDALPSDTRESIP